ncbi:uncharacterized protein LOC129757456 [Uranotaenia lowii]|uniref:uncharacterized protein LOC129757456 n=1 Tax=Uranotaenia lowii TaxID=190385 RepID=UPI00247ACA1B|nr:uncharacterized protein LOC129757456 [Uranotaenia lowii]
MLLIPCKLKASHQKQLPQNLEFQKLDDEPEVRIRASCWLRILNYGGTIYMEAVNDHFRELNISPTIIPSLPSATRTSGPLAILSSASHAILTSAPTPSSAPPTCAPSSASPAPSRSESKTPLENSTPESQLMTPPKDDDPFVESGSATKWRRCGRCLALFEDIHNERPMRC